MTPDATIRAYLAAMEAGDLAGVLACFAPDAHIISPVYGTVAVRAFYERLLADTATVKIEPHAIYQAVGYPQRWIAHFGYRWIRRDGTVVETDLIDFFSFDAALEKIAQLKIVFDSGPVASS